MTRLRYNGGAAGTGTATSHGRAAGLHTVSTWARSAYDGAACEDSDANGGVDDEAVGDVLVREVP
ncbi:MAG TPA: hypothetical protein VFD84_16445 [Candidatus Binatia bacterium]|nr:hypothetical protein [Candidatus Binatia bacterium]